MANTLEIYDPNLGLFVAAATGDNVIGCPPITNTPIRFRVQNDGGCISDEYFVYMPFAVLQINGTIASLAAGSVDPSCSSAFTATLEANPRAGGGPILLGTWDENTLPSTFDLGGAGLSTDTHDIVLTVTDCVGIFIANDVFVNEISTADFYVSESGDDGDVGDQANPWQSIAKVNAEIVAGNIVDGTIVAFERGGSYPGTLVVANVDGIEFISYGAGNAPVFGDMNPATDLGTWTYTGSDDIWTIPAPVQVYEVIRDSSRAKQARIGGTTTAAVATGYIEDSTLIGSGYTTAQFEGNWLVFRNTDWSTQGRFLIDVFDKPNGRIEYVGNPGDGGSRADYEYFVIGHPDFIADENDWAWQSGTLYYKVGVGEDPNVENIDVGTQQTVAELTNAQRTVFRNHEWRGFWRYGVIMIGNCTDSAFYNMKAHDAMGHAMYVNDRDTDNLIVDGFEMEDLSGGGIFGNRSSDCVFQNITMRRIGLTKGDGWGLYTDDGRSPNLFYCGISFGFSEAKDNQILYCYAEEIGGSPYRYDGERHVVAYNYAADGMMIFDDGGMYYCYGAGSADLTKNLHVHHNIAIRCHGDGTGTPNGTGKELSINYYLDSGSTFSIYEYNFSDGDNVTRQGFLNNLRNNDNIFRNNISIGCYEAEFVADTPTFPPNPKATTSIDHTNNQYICSRGEVTVRYVDRSGGHSQFEWEHWLGTNDNNIHVALYQNGTGTERPIRGEYNYYSAQEYFTLAEFEARFPGQELNSSYVNNRFGSYDPAHYIIHTNWSPVPVNQPVVGSYEFPDGTPAGGTVEVPPYGGVVLLQTV
jgi:hypothetical protein